MTMTSELRGLRILVVEDNFWAAEEVSGMLEELGCEVVGPVPRLDEAVEAARAEPLDGAILDLNLDGVPVFDAAAELSRRNIPYVFVSGYDSTVFEVGHRSTIVPAEFRGSPNIEKPIQFEALATALREHFRRAE